MNTKKTVTADGTVLITWEGKLHNWEGPAYIPQNNKKLAEYHIHGIRYSKEEWKSLRKDRNGIPWFKNPAFKGDARN